METGGHSEAGLWTVLLRPFASQSPRTGRPPGRRAERQALRTTARGRGGSAQRPSLWTLQGACAGTWQAVPLHSRDGAVLTDLLVTSCSVVSKTSLFLDSSETPEESGHKETPLPLGRELQAELPGQRSKAVASGTQIPATYSPSPTSDFRRVSRLLLFVSGLTPAGHSGLPGQRAEQKSNRNQVSGRLLLAGVLSFSESGTS